MTQSQFKTLCELYGVLPSVALNNELIRHTLAVNAIGCWLVIEQILLTEF